LLLDEPLGALDLKLRREMQLELKQLQTQVGITFIYVTHDQEEALTMSDRIVLMRAGRIEQIGTPREMYDCPRSRYVADFIGDTSVLRARVVDAGSLDIAGTVIRCATGQQPGSAVELSVRPEHIALHTADGGGIPAVVDAVTFVGSTSRVRVALADGQMLTALTGAPPERGQRLTVSWDPARGVIVRD
jgi:spermidine/putrescine transport system ATP-binding protein